MLSLNGGILALTLLAPFPGSPGQRDLRDEAERVRQAAAALEEILRAPDKGIPQDLLSRAHAIAVIPHVVKGAFIVGGRFGKGLVAKRLVDGTWSAPSFVDISGGSVGLQIGAEATDLVLVFTEGKALEALLEDKLELGAGASVAAGPVGRSAEAGTNLTLDSAIYSYSRSKGLFAGVALEGAVLTIDDSANHEVYSKKLKGSAILAGAAPVPKTLGPFVQTLRKYTPPRPTTMKL